MTSGDLSNFLTHLMTFHDHVRMLAILGDNILVTLTTLGEEILTNMMNLMKAL